MSMVHLIYLSDLAQADVAHLQEKERTYRGSWKKRGGVGAFMMLARKWDRLENMLEAALPKYDIFAALNADRTGADGTALAEIRDLRRYLLLVEAEMVAQGVLDLDNKHHHSDPDLWQRPGTPEDGGHHARSQMDEDIEADIAFDAAREDRVFGKR